MFGIFKIPAAELTKPVHLNTTGFPNCCGMSVVYNFPHPEWDADEERYRPEWSKHLVEQIKTDLQLIDKSLKDGYVKGNANVRLIALNHMQQKIYADALRDYDWELIMKDAYSDNHGHTLFLWSKKWYPKDTKPTNNLME